jgi:hypothetical protein
MAVTAVSESADPHCLPDVTIRACRVPAGDGDCMVTVWGQYGDSMVTVW